MNTVPADLLTLPEALDVLRRARRPRSLQSLRDRIRRGTLRGVRKGRFWYVYREDIERLIREPYHSQGGRPRSITDSSAAYAAGRLAVDVDEVLRLGSFPIEKRISAMLGAQALLFGIKRVQLKSRFPKLAPRELVSKMIEELHNGEHFRGPDVLRPSRPRAR